jgi:hypothetical protein
MTRHPGGKRYYVTPFQHQHIAQLRNQGCTWQAISERTGFSVWTVQASYQRTVAYDLAESRREKTYPAKNEPGPDSVPG